MDYNELLQAISTVGFPIAACCVLFHLYDKTLRDVIGTLKDVSNTLESVSRAVGACPWIKEGSNE